MDSNNVGLATFCGALVGALLLTGCATRQFENPVGSGQPPDPCVVWDAGTGYYYLLFTQVKPEPDLYAIDPTVLTWEDGKQYICYFDATGYPVMGVCCGKGPHAIPSGEGKLSISTPR